MNKPYTFLTRLLVALVLLVPCARVHAGGLYLFERGARALGRGGAFIAAPDDPSALWFNPAGLAESKRQVVADAVLPILLADFERLYPDGTYAPALKARQTPIPIPTLAFSHDLGFEDFTFGAGIFAPNTVLLNWERSVNGGEPSPARYSLIGLKGSVLANLAAGVAYHGLKVISFGADIQGVGGMFRAQTALSACDGAICTFPEQKSFDTYATATALPAVGVTGVFGVTINLDALRLGASVMLPYTLRGSGKLDLTLPTDAVFSEARVRGEDVTISLDFPTIVRVGSEIRPLPYLRMEGAFVWEQWSRQKSIDLEFKDITIENVTGIGDYEIGPVSLKRAMNDTWSLRGGFELTVPKKWMVVDIDIQLRGGLAYETSAFSSKTLSPLTIDADKTIMSGGLTIGLAKWLRFDTVAGWMFMKNEDVRDSEIRQPQAIRPANPALATVIGNGRYSHEAFFLGGGFRVLTDGKSFR